MIIQVVQQVFVTSLTCLPAGEAIDVMNMAARVMEPVVGSGATDDAVAAAAGAPFGDQRDIPEDGTGA
jgi:hypothetical protein